VCISPIYLVRNPLPVNVGIVSRTTSNIVFVVVFFSPSSLCLIGLSHPIRPPSCRSSLLRGSVCNPKFCVVTIGTVCGNRYNEFRFEWGLPLSRSSLDLSNPRKIIIIGACTRCHMSVKAPARKLHAQPSQRS
jgi:hypothetical protein